MLTQQDIRNLQAELHKRKKEVPQLQYMLTNCSLHYPNTRNIISGLIFINQHRIADIENFLETGLYQVDTTR